MAEQHTHINYTVADIERYLQGRMSAKEMHDMERAALQDPFLSDAIEGYSETSMEQANIHLNDINALLQQPKEEAKLVPMKVKSFQWMRAAALIAVVAGAGVISWYVLNQDKESKNSPNLAQEKASAPLEADTVSAAQDIALPKKDTALLNYHLNKQEEAPLIAKNQAREQTASAEKQQAAPGVAAIKEPGEDADNRRLTDTSATGLTAKREIKKVSPDTYAVAKPQNDPAALQTETLRPVKGETAMTKAVQEDSRKESMSSNKILANNSFTGRILDNNNLPVPNASVSLKNKHKGTSTDMNGYFSFTSADTVAKIIISAVGYADEETTANYNKLNKITLREDHKSLSEVVVTAMGKKRASVTPPKDGDNKFASPKTGWDSFEAYVYDKLQLAYDSAADNAELTGDVELEFLVDDKGDPYHFKVVRSINDQADQKAIEIIREGPKWTVDSKKKKGKVKIHF